MNNYNSYADVLESYIIAEEGFMDKVKDAGKFVWKKLKDMINILIGKIKDLIGKIRGKKTMTMDEYKTKFRKVGDPNKIKQIEMQVTTKAKKDIVLINSIIKDSIMINANIGKDFIQVTKQLQTIKSEGDIMKTSIELGISNADNINSTSKYADFYKKYKNTDEEYNNSAIFIKKSDFDQSQKILSSMNDNLTKIAKVIAELEIMNNKMQSNNPKVGLIKTTTSSIKKMYDKMNSVYGTLSHIFNKSNMVIC